MLYKWLQNLNVIIWRNPCSSRAPPMSPPLLVTLVVFNSRRELRGPYLFTAQTRNSNSVVRNVLTNLRLRILALVRICHSKRMAFTWEFGRKYSSIYDADFCFTFWQNFKWLLLHFEAYSLFLESGSHVVFRYLWECRKVLLQMMVGLHTTWKWLLVLAFSCFRKRGK